LALAAERESQDAISRARAAIGALHDAGAPITFQGVAQHAGVSRQWLYKNAQLRIEIEKLRGRQMGTRPCPQRSAPAMPRCATTTRSRKTTSGCEPRTPSSKTSSPRCSATARLTTLTRFTPRLPAAGLPHLQAHARLLSRLSHLMRVGSSASISGGRPDRRRAPRPRTSSQVEPSVPAGFRA
jgi:uncharacterized protein DUF6262